MKRGETDDKIYDIWRGCPWMQSGKQSVPRGEGRHAAGKGPMGGGDPKQWAADQKYTFPPHGSQSYPGGSRAFIGRTLRCDFRGCAVHTDRNAAGEPCENDYFCGQQCACRGNGGAFAGEKRIICLYQRRRTQRKQLCGLGRPSQDYHRAAAGCCIAGRAGSEDFCRHEV